MRVSQNATGHSGRAVFVGDRVTRADMTRAMLLDAHRLSSSQNIDPSSAGWGRLYPQDGIDY